MANIDQGTEDARDSLDEVQDAQQAKADRTRTPDWFWHGIGAGLLLIAVAQMLPSIATIVVTAVVALGVGGVVGGMQEHAGTRADFRDPATARTTVLSAAALLGLFVVASILRSTLGWVWVWAIVGSACYLLVVALGRRVDALVAEEQ